MKCPIHDREFEQVEERTFDVVRGFHRILQCRMLIAKKICPATNCKEVIFVEQNYNHGIVLDGVKEWPKGCKPI